MKYSRDQSGFTLFELLLCLFFGAVIAGMTLPSLWKFYQRCCLQQAASLLCIELHKAQEWALIHHQTVLMVPLSAWNKFQLMSGDKKIIHSVVLPDSLLIKWRGFPVWKNQIEFLPNGLLAQENGHFDLYLSEMRSRLSISKSGVIRCFLVYQGE